jgi:DNA processing protein
MNSRIYSIALSIIAKPLKYNLWDLIPDSLPEFIYKSILKFKPLVQNYLLEEYSSDPLMAAKEILKRTDAKGIRILDYWDDNYPHLLKEISRPPIILYVKGDITFNKSFSIVGTRNCDEGARKISAKIASDLAGMGYTIVSGMAIGIDRAAHTGALNGEGGTVGVLANGIDMIYPYSNRDLFKRIEDDTKSALISEYPPGIKAGRWTFVRRNRIISGLSSGLLVVQAGMKSGSLITAKYALEQNRDVFICPGNTFDSSYQGCNNLIRSGAILVSETTDIIEELTGLQNISLPPFEADTILSVQEENLFLEINFSDDSVENKILSFLSSSKKDIDSIIRNFSGTGLEIQQALMNLEFSGRIERFGNLVSLK